MSFQPVNYRPRYSNYSLLQAQSLCAAAINTAAMAPAATTSLGMRGSTLSPPPGETFAGMVADALEEELGQAGLHDQHSTTAIDVLLLDTRLDTGAGTGDATLRVQFTTRRTDREPTVVPISARREWPSSFFGVTALEQGRTQYGQLVADLLHQLFTDAAFVDSLRCEPNA